MFKRKKPQLLESPFGITDDDTLPIGHPIPRHPPLPLRTRKKPKVEEVKAQPSKPVPKSATEPTPRKKKARRSKIVTQASSKKRVPHTRSIVTNDDSVVYTPDMRIRYDKLELPEVLKGLPVDNAVALSDRMLNSVRNRTENRTRRLSNLILQSVVPSLVACDASLAYTKTFLESGFGFSTKPDDSMIESLNDLVRFEVLSFFVNRSRLSKAVKARLLDALTDKFADQMVVSMRDALKKAKVDDRVKELEAFVVRTMSDQKVRTSRDLPGSAQESPTGGRGSRNTGGRGSLKRRAI